VLDVVLERATHRGVRPEEDHMKKAHFVFVGRRHDRYGFHVLGDRVFVGTQIEANTEAVKLSLMADDGVWIALRALPVDYPFPGEQT
jgi:hypothetical protein